MMRRVNTATWGHASLRLLSQVATAAEPSAFLLQRVVCPLSKGPLVYDSVKREMVSLNASVAFPVLADGTMDLVPMHGRVMNGEELQAFKAKQA